MMINDQRAFLKHPSSAILVLQIRFIRERVMVAVDQLVQSLPGVPIWIMVISVQTGLFLRPSFSTFTRENVFVVVEVPVIVFVKVSLHFLFKRVNN